MTRDQWGGVGGLNDVAFSSSELWCAKLHPGVQAASRTSQQESRKSCASRAAWHLHERYSKRERERGRDEREGKKKGTDSERGAQENTVCLSCHSHTHTPTEPVGLGNLYRHRHPLGQATHPQECVDLHGRTDKAHSRLGYRHGEKTCRSGGVGTSVTLLSSTEGHFFGGQCHWTFAAR